MTDKSATLNFLVECCSLSLTAQMILLHTGRTVSGALRALRQGRLIVVLDGELDETPFPNTLCCLSFTHQKSLHACLACVDRIRDSSDGLEVHFELPSSVVSTSLRRTYRVPISPDSGVTLTLVIADGGRIVAEPLNLSETGAEISLSCDDPRLILESEVQVELRLREELLSVPAIVKRSEPGRRGLQFQLASAPERRQCAAALQQLVRALEQNWLRNHLV